jgi:prepilin-type N-terminal cleavage/methylation domain-containing protein
MRTTPQSRRGFSLIEVTIALGVFSALMVALMQSMISISGYVSQEEGLGDLATMGRAAINQITNDMANTAWFYQYNPGAHKLANPLTPLYPLVTKNFVTSTDSSGNTVTNELDSIEFIKIRTSSTVSSSPYDEHYSSMPFMTNTTPPAVVTIDQYNGVNTAQTTSTPLLVANSNYPQAPDAFDILVSHVWESAFVGYSFDQNMDPTMLRHYRLEVITNSQNVQQLVRSYYNGNGGTMPADVNGSWNPGDQPVLMDYVQSFVVNTQQNTQGGTNNIQANQISFSITVNKPNPNNPTTTTLRTFTVYASMRSITH